MRRYRALNSTVLVRLKTTSGRIGQDDGIMVCVCIHGSTLGIHSVSKCERAYVVMDGYLIYEKIIAVIVLMTILHYLTR